MRRCCPHAARLGPELCPRCAAARLCVSPRWLAQRRGRGGGPPVVRLGRFVRYLATDLDAFVLAHRQEHPCRSTVSIAPRSTGADSGCVDVNTASRLASEIAARLRAKSVSSEMQPHAPSLRLIPSKE